MAPPLFPSFPGLGFSVYRTPIWRAIDQEAISGKRARFALWSFPQYRYKLSFNFLRNNSAEQQSLVAFFNAVAGSAGIFQFTDPDDNAATNAALGLGDGTTRAFQLYRYYGASPTVFADPVFAVTGTPTFAINGTPVGGVGVSASGVATFPSPPGAGLAVTWTGMFNWYCRFDADTADFEKFLSNFYRLKQVSFTTEKIVQ